MLFEAFLMFLPLAPINIDFAIYLYQQINSRIEREEFHNILVKIPACDLFVSFQTDVN